MLVQAPDSNGGVYVRLARELVAKWQTNALVTRAADETVRQLLTQNLRSVVHHFEDLVWIARTSVEELLGIYLLALAQSMPEWGSHPLFLAFQHISQNLTDDQRWPTVEMAAQHLLTKVEAAMPPPPDVAADTPHAVAGLLFSLCGHIDAHVRWDALHGGRFLSRVTPGDLWAAFIPLTVATEAPTGFSHHGEKHDDFRWMTARVYALLLIERVADETPAVLRCYVKDLQNHLFAASFPHAQVRELARRALLRVSAAFPSDLDDQTKQQIKLVNRPKSCLYPRQSRYSINSSRVGWTHGVHVINAGKGFNFDSMDVIPHWFNPASEVFHIDTSSFVDAAEEWVAQRWGMSNDDARSDWEKLEGRYPFGVWMNRHGSLPRVEIPSIYLSYHAMHCVMGQLIEELPISVDLSDDEDEPAACPWEGWLNEFLPGEQGIWLSDLRRPTPLEQELWQPPQNVSQWLEEGSESAFDQVRFPHPERNEGWTLAYASISYHSDAIYASAHLESALVCPDKATALLRALEAAGPRNWQVPIRGWSYGDWTVHEDDFSLEAWLTHRRHHNGFDHLDPKAKDIPTDSRLEADSVFSMTMGLTQSQDRLKWYDAAGTLVGHLEYWSDNPQTERSYVFFTYGNRLWIRTDVMLQFLQQSRNDLIISTFVDRNYSYDYMRHRDIKRKKDAARTSLHLFRADGGIETMAGRRPLGPVDSEGTGAC